MSASKLSQDQALRILRQRRAAHDWLTVFAEVIDIPGVPLDAEEDEWSLVETPLADHHKLTLWALQGMVDGSLLYDPESLDPITRATPSGLRWVDRPVGGRADGGVGHIKGQAPSGNSPNLSHSGNISPKDGNQAGDITCDTARNSLTSNPVHRDRTIGESGRDLSDQTHERVTGSMLTGRSESGLPGSLEPTQSQPRQMLPGESEGREPILDGQTSESRHSLITGEIANSPRLRGVRYATCRRVMIMMPPGSAKSTYASVVFPAWVMGRNPDTEIILTGWGDPICRRHGKRARTICASDLYRGVMSTWLDPQTKAAEDWALTNRSSYKSSGINSGVAGFRCDGLVWDDLTKNRKEADSQTIRDDVYNAYIDDARSRKKPNAWEVGIGTRWHEDEIMGRILPEGYAGESGYMQCRDGNVWLIICLAAECERDDDPLGRQVGEMIWPEWFDEGYWAEKRVSPRSWGSLYQQRPAPEEGIYFKKEWIKRYTELPQGDNYMSFDPAVTGEESNSKSDDTCLATWRVDEFARIYLVDDYINKVTMDVWIEELLRRAKIAKPLEIVSESGVIRRASEPFIKRAMINLKAFFRFEWVTRHADKAAMARAAQGMMASGQIFLPEGPVGDKWEDELLKFPASKQDHRVDTLANLCLRLENIWESQPIKDVPQESGIIGGDSISIKKLMPPRFPKRKNRWKKTYRMSPRTR